MRALGRLLPGLLGAALVLGRAAPGAAQAPAGGAEAQRSEAELAQVKAAAQALFDEARKLTGAGRHEEACPKLAESYRLDPTMGTKFYLAECYEQIGKLASAWSYYLEVASAARAAGQAEREEYARGRADALRPRLPALVVEVTPAARAAAGLQIQRDGVALGEPQWGLAIPVDLGEHTIGARAPGKKGWEARVTVRAEGEAVTVAVPALADEAPRPAAAAPEQPQPARPAPAQGEGAPPARGSAQRTAGLVLGAGGLVGIGLGAVFGLRAMSAQQDSNEGGRCDAQGFCDAEGMQLRDDAIQAASVATLGFVAGGVALAAGAALFLTAPSDAGPAPAQGARPAPRQVGLALGPRGVALLGRF